MKGLTRCLDELGRVVIPKEIRSSFGIGPNDPINIEAVSGGILLSPLKASCVICGSTDNILVVDQIGLCKCCADRLINLVKENNND